MGRKYTAAEYKNGINKLRTAFPGAAITTDIMVGFPGETEEEFEESLTFAKNMEFAKMHIFPYSIRPGTRASKMNGQLTLNEKKLRVEKLEIIDKIIYEKEPATAENIQYPATQIKTYLSEFISKYRDMDNEEISLARYQRFRRM